MTIMCVNVSGPVARHDGLHLVCRIVAHRQRQFANLILGSVLLCLASAASANDATDDSAILRVKQVESPSLFAQLFSADGQPSVSGPELGEGKWTLVMLWATTCHLCEQQKPVISDFHSKHKDVDAKVYGIALDGPRRSAEVSHYMQNNNVTFPTYIGTPAMLGGAYMSLTGERFRGTPTYLFFNPKGELLAHHPGGVTAEALEQFMARNTP